MENAEVARTLREVADLLEIQGAGPFRVRAYRNAVRTVQAMTRPLRTMVAEGEDLTGLPDIGKSMAANVVELVETGRLERLEELGKEVPRSLTTLVRLSGVGPKKARKLWDELGVTTVDQLEVAIGEGRVAALDGFGKRSSEQILSAILQFRRNVGRLLLSEADELLTPLLEHMRACPAVERIEVAGSYRRRKETIGDLDLLALSTGPLEETGAEIIEHFVGYPGVAEVNVAGGTKGSVVLSGGVQVDLRVLPRESFGAALQYFTGSKEHNVRLRTLAIRNGLRINEWGVYRVPEDADPNDIDLDSLERVAGETEEEVYRTLELPVMPAVLRENRGEIEAARSGTLPALVAMEDIKGELHMHSTWSDGKLSIAEMVAACRDWGLTYAVITDHTPAVGVAGGLDSHAVRSQWEEIERLRESLSGFTLFRGLEVDILKDGSLDAEDDILVELDYVVVSVHSFMNMDQAQMTERIIKAIQHPSVDQLGHPTGRLLGRRDPYPLDVEAVLEVASELGVVMEINSSPRRLDLSDVHAFRARELGIPVAINTDAHSLKDLERRPYGVDQARRAWFTANDVLNARSVEEFRSWLDRRDA